MKKMLVITIAAVACIALAIGATVAYNSQVTTSVNVVTMSDLDIVAHSMTIPEGSQDPVEFKGGLKFMPSRQHSWIFTVENTGSQDAYVRVSVKKIIKLASGVSGNPDPDVMQLDINTAKWTYKEGFYYYNEALAAGKTTDSLFTTVTFDKDADNMYQMSTADAEIFVSATQVKNNGTDVMTAAGWPEDN